jgi:hypothetical protein
LTPISLSTTLLDMPNFVGAGKHRGQYNAAHQRARARAFSQLPEWSSCVRCGGLLWKWQVDSRGRSAIHYDHADDNRGYLGFAHSVCNIRAGAAKGGRLQHAHNHRIGYPPGTATHGTGTPGPGW